MRRSVIAGDGCREKDARTQRESDEGVTRESNAYGRLKLPTNE